MKIKLTKPKETKIKEVKVLERIIHFDPRGFLVETLRADDKEVAGENFVMTYTSATPGGVARDENQWHFHKDQEDRFVVVLGEIALALADLRKNSQTFGLCQVLDLKGANWSDFEKAKNQNSKFDIKTYLVTVPIGVYHCYKNIGKNLVILQNFPTQLYNPQDEGRELFKNLKIQALDRPFSWNLVKK